MAKEAGVGLLALTHLSSRFMPREVRAEAEAVFANVIVPRDFDQIEVPFPERGAPILHPVKGGGERKGASDVASEAPATVLPARPFNPVPRDREGVTMPPRDRRRPSPCA